MTNWFESQTVKRLFQGLNFGETTSKDALSFHYIFYVVNVY